MRNGTIVLDRSGDARSVGRRYRRTDPRALLLALCVVPAAAAFVPPLSAWVAGGVLGPHPETHPVGNGTAFVVGSLVVVVALVVLSRLAGAGMVRRRLEFRCGGGAGEVAARASRMLDEVRFDRATVAEIPGEPDVYVLEAGMPRKDDPTGRGLFDRMERFGLDAWGR